MVAERSVSCSATRRSPFYCFGESHFAEVRQLFAARPPAGTEADYEARLEAMERAVALLDAEGLFGAGDERRDILVNVEVMPPDETNTARAARLNPPDAEGGAFARCASGKTAVTVPIT